MDIVSKRSSVLISSTSSITSPLQQTPNQILAKNNGQRPKPLSGAKKGVARAGPDLTSSLHLLLKDVGSGRSDR